MFREAPDEIAKKILDKVAVAVAGASLPVIAAAEQAVTLHLTAISRRPSTNSTGTVNKTWPSRQETHNPHCTKPGAPHPLTPIGAS